MGLRNFKSALYLDDVRVPLILGIDLVRNYDEFVEYLQTHTMPELISFDHDLALEHYACMEEEETRTSLGIPYHTYKEKTGLVAAQYIVANHLPVQYWTVHSANPVGSRNIRETLRSYCTPGSYATSHLAISTTTLGHALPF